jgi:hypothetical protein
MRLIWPLLLSACLSTDREVQDLLAELADQDGDGFAAIEDGGEDCDDNDVRIFPGAHDEWYDGIDSDCADNDDFDADSDGFQASHWDGDDCNDQNADIHPEASELCLDEIDNDCDGLVDVEDTCTG